MNWKDIIHYTVKGNPKPQRGVEKTDAEWKELLRPEQYLITCKKGTEAAHSGALCGIFEEGEYLCICCNTPLFDSSGKFNSSSGWPSFTEPIEKSAVKYEKDVSFGMVRVETLCTTCDAHSGHVFPDGPEPSGLRFCINSEAIKIKK